MAVWSKQDSDAGVVEAKISGERLTSKYYLLLIASPSESPGPTLRPSACGGGGSGGGGGGNVCVGAELLSKEGGADVAG